jgi:hypothetical protein
MPSKRSESAAEISTPLTPPLQTAPTTNEVNAVPLVKQPKPPVPLPNTTPSAETVIARNLLIQSIKEKVKRID